ncbi:hypothetical protein SAMN05444521_3932 [Streptomyces sp. 3214.6]|nr:hypothetical protein SAMN05444521_3932 [Streptomyces sp. 3214.6]
MFTEPTVLRGLAAAAAATAIVGAVVMRRWDMQAGKQVADLTRARAGDEWRYEERVAELESDLDESRELRVKLEQRLRSKRAELAGLRNEHAALLRRYATAETERASALEGRRLLEIEAAPSPALPAARTAQDAEPTGTPTARDIEATEGEAAVETDTEAQEAEKAERVEETQETPEAVESGESVESAESGESAEEEPKAPAVFSPEGSKLFLRAQVALARFDTDSAKPAKSEDHAEEEPARTTSVEVTAGGGEAEAAQEDEAQGKPEAADEHARAVAPHTADEAIPAPRNEVAESDEAKQDAPEETSAEANEAHEANEAGEASEAHEANDAAGAVGVTRAQDVNEVRPARPELSPAPAPAGSAPAAEVGSALVRRPAAPVQRPSGHFAVPTAVAVVPAAQPVRRPTAEGGFDFFGTKSASSSDTLESVQNEDLADVVGQEALALHKAESEAEFKPVDEASRGVGQVIDLTAHDETEVIDLQGLRSAVS